MITYSPPPRMETYALCDSVLPQACAGYPNIATYVTGPYANDPADLPYHGGDSVTIDVNGSDPSARALDVEPGDATPEQAGQWVREHDQVSDEVPIVYSDQSEWPAVQAAVAGVPVKFWVANPGGGPVAGAWMTQTYWGQFVDLSSVG